MILSMLSVLIATVTGVDVDLPLCAAWKTSGVTVAEHKDTLGAPVGLYAARDGTLYVVDRENHRVMKYAPNGTRNGTQIGDGEGSGPRQLDSPNAVVVNEAMNAVYISDYKNNRVQLWHDGGMGARVETVLEQLTTNDFSRAEDIQLDPRSNDTLYALENRHQRVSKWELPGKYIESSSEAYHSAAGIYVDAQRNVYVVESGLSEIFKWENGRRVSRTGESASPLNRLNKLTAVVVDSVGRIFIADSMNHRIVLWELNAPESICIVGCSATSGNQTDQLTEPKDLTFDWKGNLLVADTGNHRVQRFDLFINTSCVNTTVTERIFSSALTTTSPRFALAACLIPNYYYEATQLSVETTGSYQLSSNSSIGLHAYIYQDTFDSVNASFHQRAEKSGDFGFRLHVFLESNTTYVLVVTSATPNQTGSFSIIAEGPSTITTVRFNTSAVEYSTYSSALTTSSATYSQHSFFGASKYFYQALQLNMTVSGNYRIWSYGDMHMYGRLYRGTFDPVDPDSNVMAINYRVCDYKQFRLHAFLQVNITYILVVTTYDENTTGTFSIFTHGEATIRFTQLEFSSMVHSSYSSKLDTSSAAYFLDVCSTKKYYYIALRINVSITGQYAFMRNSSLDLLGYVYQNSFDPVNPFHDQIAKAPVSWGNEMFSLQSFLQANTSYVLLVATLTEGVAGAISILTKGAADLRFTPEVFSSIVRSTYSSALTTNSSTYSSDRCGTENSYYQALQIGVLVSGHYSFSSSSDIMTFGYLYRDNFDPFDPSRTEIASNYFGCDILQFRLSLSLQANTSYILVMTTFLMGATGPFSILATGAVSINFTFLHTPSVMQSTYKSEFTTSSDMYSRGQCQSSDYYFQALRVEVTTGAVYRFISGSTIYMYGYLYQDTFYPAEPSRNLLLENGRICSERTLWLNTSLSSNTTYILVATTDVPARTGKFVIYAFGVANVTFSLLAPNASNCFLGGRCSRSIGLTLDDILHYEMKQNTTLIKHSLLVKISAALTTIMFVAGLINSVLSFLTFHNKEARQVGSGIYLLTSSITSFLTICMLTVKFWFFVLTQMNASISYSVLRGGCVAIEPTLKVALNLDGWLNACVAIERAIAVSRGVKFNKKRSQTVARWIVLFLPFVILGSIIHEPLHRQLFDDQEMESVWCVTRYPSSVQYYNTVILFFHFLGPAAANLFSALFIILGTVRQRTLTQVGHNYTEQFRRQLREHKQLLISPVILFVLSLPRLIISLISGCADVSRHPWLYVSGYFISFIPSVLIFVVYVLPSGLYKRQFRVSVKRWRQRLHRSLTLAPKILRRSF